MRAMAMVAGLVALGLSGGAHAQVSRPLTLARIFASPSLAGPAPRAAALSPDGRYASWLQPRPADQHRYDLWVMDTRTGARRMLIDSTKVGSGAAPTEAEKMRQERARTSGDTGVLEYHWAPDGQSLILPLDGDLYRAALDGRVAKLTQGEVVIDPKIAPGGHVISFVAGQNLVGIDPAGHGRTALSVEGGGTVTCGTAEFVAEEEMNRFTGAWWSPTGARVAYECYDEAHVPIVRRTAIGAGGTSVIDQRYPATGQANVTVTLHLVSPDGGNRVAVDLGDNPDIYLARVDWAPDGRTLYVQRQSRDQKRLDLLAVDPMTGRAHILFTETASTWVALNDDFRALKDGSVLWGSARDGYLHLYRFAGGRWTQLTRGPWSLEENGQSEHTGLIGVDEARHLAFVEANRDDVLESQIYAVDYLNPGTPRRLTERGYWTSAAMDAGATRMLVTRASPTQPPQVYIADATGRRIAWVEENRVDATHPLAPYIGGFRPVTFGTITGPDGSALHYEMITPPLTPGKRYPVFFEHYGGPSEQVVRRDWMSPLAQYWVQKGWVYFAIDNRGSANRGRAFEDQIYHAMGSVEVDDQAAGARWLATQPFVDPRRIATFGWSYGGYMTLKMLERADGLYAAGVAVAPVTKWEYYDTHYTEQYLGKPQDDAAVYARADAVDQADAMRAPLLLIHGLSDDNVVFQNSAALIDRLQAAAHPFTMMLFTGQTHAISGPNRRLELFNTVEAFLNRTVRDRPMDERAVMGVK